MEKCILYFSEKMKKRAWPESSSLNSEDLSVKSSPESSKVSIAYV